MSPELQLAINALSEKDPVVHQTMMSCRVSDMSEVDTLASVVLQLAKAKSLLEAELLRNEKERLPSVIACNELTRRQHIEAVVGDRLTAEKADHICERDGYAVTGVVLTLPDGRACLVNMSAVRWLEDQNDLWEIMRPVEQPLTSAAPSDQNLLLREDGYPHISPVAQSVEVGAA